MNPEKPSREEIEAKLTALLLGELPAEEAQLLRWAISQDAALARLHDRLKLTVGFVREVAANPAETIPAQTAPLKLSGERREKLLAHFKTIAPREFVPLVPPLKKRREISPLLAMAAAIALIAVLAAMLLPALASSKSKAKRIMAMNQEKLRELNGNYATVTAAPSAAAPEVVVDQNPPVQSASVVNQFALTPHALPGGIVTGGPVVNNTPSQPQVALDRRVAGLEAYISNTDPTANGADAWKKQTPIVLPAGGTDDKELAAASPAPSGQFTFGAVETRDFNAYGLDVKNADPNQVAPVLQNMFDSGATHDDSTTTSPLQTRATQTYSTPGASSVVSQPSALQPSSEINLALPDNGQTVAAANRRNSGGSGSGGLGGGGFGGAGGGRGGRGGGGAGGGGGAAEPQIAEAQKSPDMDEYDRVFVPDPPHALDSGGHYVLVRKKDQTTVAASDSGNSGGTLASSTANGFVDVSGQLNPAAQTEAVAPNYSFGNKANGINLNSADIASDAPVDKVPFIGDLPKVGSLFKSSANWGSFDGPAAATPAATVTMNGEISGVGGIAKTGNGTLALNGVNTYNGAYNGATIISGGALNAPVSTVNSSDSDQLLTGGLQNTSPALKTDPNNGAASYYSNLASQDYARQEHKHTIDTDNRMVQVEEGWQKSAATDAKNTAKDENGKLAYNNNGTVGTAQISADPDTHNLIAASDAATVDEVRGMNKKLDEAPPAPAETQQWFLDRKAQLGADVYARQQVQSQPPAAGTDDPLARLRAERDQDLQAGLAGGGVINNSASAPVVAASPAVTPPAPVSTMPSPVVAEKELRLALNNEAKTANIPVKVGNVTTNIPSNDEIVTEIFPLRFTDAQKLVADLSEFTSPQTTIVANQAGNSIVVTDTQSNLQRLSQAIKSLDRAIQNPPQLAPVPTPEILTRENAFSTFSLNVSDVSFKLAAASLERGQLPDAASIRSEEFINAFDYRDPEPLAGVPVSFVAERARDPFAHNRDLLRFSIKTAAAGREPGRPLNIVLLLDNSGSMERADRVAIIHEALKVLASQLQPQDTLSIVTFARTARLWVDGARGDQAGTAVNKVSDLTPEGGTNLEEAMNLAYATARRHYLANGVNRVVLLTDGAANLGNVNPEALKQKVESFRKQGIALDCFGIGWEGYNDDLLEVLSSNGDGRYGFINTPEAATTEFAAQLAGALHVAAEDVKVQVEFNPQRVISYRQIGYAKHQLTKEQFRDNTVAAAPMAAREAGNALYTVEVNPQGTGPVATVRVRFRIPGTTDVSEHEWQVPFDGTAPALEKSSPALRLAATASAFSEWLASSPFAQEVTPDQLLNYLNGVPAIYGADPRPKQLETMIREAKSLSGK